MKNLISILLATCLLLSTFAPAIAHDHGQANTNRNVYLVTNESYKTLIRYLEEHIENSKRFSVPLTTDEERKAGEKLITETFEVFEEMIDMKGDGPTDRVVYYIKGEVIPKLNPWYMGKKVLDLARRVGPRFAITITAVEILENLTYLAAAYNPKLTFLVPVVFFHGYDAVGFTYIFGIPFLYERVGIFKRFGGYKKGPEEFYKFLINQKNDLPLDWSVVLDVQKTKLPMEGGDTEIDLVILKKNLLERFISPKYKELIFPRRSAQRETSNALSVTDIERIAKELGIKLHVFRGIPQEPPLYSRMVLHSVLNTVGGPRLVAKKLKEQKTARIFTEPIKDSSFNAAQLFKSESAEDFALIGESPDILALRLSWYILGEAEEIKNSDATKKIDYKLLREIVAVANKELKRISETDYSNNPRSGFIAIHKSIKKVKGLIKQFESSPQLCRDAMLMI